MRIPIPPNTDSLDVTLVQRGSTVRDHEALDAQTREGALGLGYGQKNRGRSVDLGPLRTSNPVDLVSVVGNDQLARQMTLTCQVTPKQIAGVDFTPIVGDLTWGNDGFMSRAEFDFLNGTQVTLAGSFVRLAARFDTDAEVEAEVPLVRVGAHLGYLPPATSPLYRTRYANALAAAAAATFDVPFFAERIDVLRTGPDAAVTLEFLNRLGTVITATASAGPISLRLPNDVRQVRLTNNAGAPINARLVFSLWL